MKDALLEKAHTALVWAIKKYVNARKRLGLVPKVRFLERKNEQFFQTTFELMMNNAPIEVQYWCDDPKALNSQYRAKYPWCAYYDLVVVNFHDESGYDRSMTLPVPLLDASTHPGAVLLVDYLDEHTDDVVICDREAYERCGQREPIAL